MFTLRKKKVAPAVLADEQTKLKAENSAAEQPVTGIRDETKESKESRENVEKNLDGVGICDETEESAGNREYAEKNPEDAEISDEIVESDGNRENVEKNLDGAEISDEIEKPEDVLPEEEIPDCCADDAAMMAAFEAWLEDSIPDEGRREAAKSTMDKVRESLLSGDFDEALFDVIAKGADYDRAIAEAEEAGEVKGRNASIDELLADDDDGIPHPGTSCGGSWRGPSIFDLAREA